MKKKYETEKTFKGYISNESLTDNSLIDQAEVIKKISNNKGTETYFVKASNKDIKKRWLPFLNINAFMYFYKKNHVFIVFKDMQFHFNYKYSENWNPVIDYALRNGFTKEQFSFPIDGKIYYEL